jgi:hypothetical protein
MLTQPFNTSPIKFKIMIKAQLPTPILAFGKTITQIAWRINYPENLMYYQLQTDDGISLKEGNWIVPIEVINAWGTDDSVISNAVLAAKTWEL